MFVINGYPFSRVRHRSMVYSVFVALVLLSSCDTLDTGSDDSILLNTTIEELCFEFSGITAGQAASALANAEDSIDLGPFLDGQNFDKSDILSAEVTSAQLRMIFPIEASLSAIRDVSLQLTSGGGNTVQVASAASLGDTRRASLTTAPTDIGNLAASSSFRAALSFEGATSISEDVVIEGEIVIRVEVAGL